MSYTEANYENAVICLPEQLGGTHYYGPGNNGVIS